MKRTTTIALVCLLILIGAAFLSDRPAYLYPALPFPLVSKHSVISVLKESDNQLKRLASDTSF